MSGRTLPDLRQAVEIYAAAPVQARAVPLWAMPVALAAALAGAIALSWVLAYAMYGVCAAVGRSLDPEGWRALTAFETLFFAAAIGTVLAWLKWVERRPAATAGLTAFRIGALEWRWIGLGALWAAVSLLLTGVVDETTRRGTAEGVARLLSEPGRMVVAAVVVSLLSVVAAAAEEVVYRGWLLSALAPRLGLGWAIAVTSVLFALPHFVAGELSSLEGLLTFVMYVAIGSTFALIAVRHGHLYGVIAAHAAYNTLLFMVDYGRLQFDGQRVFEEVLAATRVIQTPMQALLLLMLELALLLTLRRRWSAPQGFGRLAA